MYMNANNTIMARSFMPTPQTGLACGSGPEVVESELKSPMVLTPYASTINALGSERVCGSTTDTSGPAIPLTGVNGVGSGLAGPGPDYTGYYPRPPITGSLLYYKPNKTDYKLLSY